MGHIDDTSKQEIIRELKRDLLLLQGFKSRPADAVDMGLGPISPAFPNQVFPTGAVHEFISDSSDSAVASVGFMSCLIARLMATGAPCLWVASERQVFPPGLKRFGIDPSQIVFVDLKKEKQVLWVLEEALKQEGLAAVVGEVKNINDIASRRLQIAAEKTGVTGFLLRHITRAVTPIASVARWKITPLPSEGPKMNMPGLGFPRWSVELERVRNGKPGSWIVECTAGRLRFLSPIATTLPIIQQQQKITG
ncbi:MAG TPA: Error-prone repair protein ImuA [Puia sp.]|jgi:protein ImuA